MVELTCKQLGATWGIAETKTSQAFAPWWEKFILLALDHPVELAKLYARATEEAAARRAHSVRRTPYLLSESR